VKPAAETRWPQTEDMTMKKHSDAAVMLEYSIRRYKEMGEGVKCQKLISRLNKVLAGQARAN
jgi:hypothetical protein